MIPAPAGLVAKYKGADDTKPVLAFDDEGRAMVLGDRGLVYADGYYGRELDHISDYHSDPTLAGLIPAGGWRIEHTGQDGAKWSQPLVGWGLRVDGTVVPLDTDDGGNVDSLAEVGGTWRVYHPDATETGASES
jgi:hypothetical protein